MLKGSPDWYFSSENLGRTTIFTHKNQELTTDLNFSKRLLDGSSKKVLTLGSTWIRRSYWELMLRIMKKLQILLMFGLTPLPIIR